MSAIYLCGPIHKCDTNFVTDWRKEAAAIWGGEVIDPMRRDYRGLEYDKQREIVEQDKLDIQSCDGVLVFFPFSSVGTSMEILSAWDHGKPISVWAAAEAPLSPWLTYHATVVCGTLELAVAELRHLVDAAAAAEAARGEK